jgi:Leucine-rich repeat (LRR) protein
MDGSLVFSGDETALRYRYDEAEMMGQDQSARRAITARDGPLHPPGRDGAAAAATGVVRRQGAGAAYATGSVPLRQDVETAAVDLEAVFIPPGLDDTCCRVVGQGAAVGQLMWRRKNASRSLSALVVIGSCSQARVAMAVRVNTSAASAGILNMTAERSELLKQPARPQPSGDTRQQLHSTRPFIPTDLVQNTAEYLGRVAPLLSFRGVSTEWQGAVSDAVGFLNGRCWNRLECSDRSLPLDSEELWLRHRLDDAAVVARCAVLCLRQRLEKVTCGRSWTRVWFPLRLLGETNETLVTLSLHDERRPLDDLSCLLGCVALRELSLRGTQVTNESFAGLGPLLARLHRLDLSWCEQLKAISNLAPATSLRELNLTLCTNLRDLHSLDKLVALETLAVTNIRTIDLSILRQCPRLVTLSAKGDITALESIIHAAAPSLVDCRLHIDGPVSALDSRSLSCLRRSTVLKFRDLDNASLQGLEEIPSLELLDVERTCVDDVRSLAGCRALKELRLARSSVTDVGIIGLERIATLETLHLTYCLGITSVTSLRHCTALREVILDGTSVTDAGIAGLECIVTLTKLSLVYCNLITSVSSLRRCPSLRELDISSTKVTAAGIEGLDAIGTLQCLGASRCFEIDDVTTLSRCRSLREVDLSHSDVTDAVLATLADVSTLETLRFVCVDVRDVNALARSVSLRELDLGYSAVCDTGIARLERIPSLTRLSLASCEYITNVTSLFHSKSLRILLLSSSSVTDAGLEGLEMAPALEFVDLRGCADVTDVAAVVQRAAERLVKVDGQTGPS